MNKNFEEKATAFLINTVALMLLVYALNYIYHKDLNTFIFLIVISAIIVWYMLYRASIWIINWKNTNLGKVDERTNTISTKTIHRIMGFIICIEYGLFFLYDYLEKNGYHLYQMLLLIPILFIAYILIRYSFWGYDPSRRRYRSRASGSSDSSIKDFAARNGIMDEYNAFGDFLFDDLFGGHFFDDDY